MAVLGSIGDSRLHRHDLGLHDYVGIHLPQTHADQAQQRHPSVRHVRLKPEFAVIDRHDQQDDHDHDGDRAEDQQPRQVVFELAEIGKIIGSQNREQLLHDGEPTARDLQPNRRTARRTRTILHPRGPLCHSLPDHRKCR